MHSQTTVAPLKFGIGKKNHHALYLACDCLILESNINHASKGGMWKLEQNGWQLPHDDVIKWKHFPRYWPFVRGIYRPPVNSPHKGQWRGALIFSMICGRINGWVNNRDAGDLRRYRAHYYVIVMGQNFRVFLLTEEFCIFVFWLRFRRSFSYDVKFSGGFYKEASL